MNRTIAEMYDKSFDIELEILIKRLLIHLKEITLFQGEAGSWARIDADKEPLFEYIKTLVQMDIYQAVPLLIRFLGDLEKNQPFAKEIPANEQNEDAFFRVAVRMDIAGEPFTYKRLAGDKTASILYFYSPDDSEYGLAFYQMRLSLLKAEISNIAQKMIPVAEYHKAHDNPAGNSAPSTDTTAKTDEPTSPATPRPAVPKLPK